MFSSPSILWNGKRNWMKRIVTCLRLLLLGPGLQGCAMHHALTLAHDVNVPIQFRSGNFSEQHPGFDPGNSTIERYVDAYERGWAYCVRRYADNINFDDPSPVAGIGWIEEVDGFSAGYYDARDRIGSLIHTYGKERVSLYLQQYRDEVSAF